MDKYNIQSGIYRGELGGGNGKIAHRDRVVRAIETDGLNQVFNKRNTAFVEAFM